MLNFTGQTHLIVGGASGIGVAVAEKLSALNATVVIADRNFAGAKAKAEALGAGGKNALAIEVDVADEAAVDAIFERTLQFSDRLHGVTHCAGIGVERTILDTTLEDWNRLIGINLTGTFLVARQAAKVMGRSGYGRILLMGSAAGDRGGTGRTAYAASKGGVHALTRVLAVELAELGVTFNAMAPGAIETDLVKQMHDDETRQAYCSRIPANRYGTPEEVADVAVFLVSVQAGYVNGVVMPIDGGFMGSGVTKRGMNPGPGDLGS